MTFNQTGDPGKQAGAVLVISLVMLLVITLLGVGALESSLLQQKMAVNAQNKNRAFQDTASILENILRDEAILGGSATVLHDAIVRGEGVPGNSVNYISSGPVSADYVVTYMGESNPFVREGQEMSFSSPIPQRRFELSLMTENSETQVRATHIQGFVPN